MNPPLHALVLQRCAKIAPEFMRADIYCVQISMRNDVIDCPPREGDYDENGGDTKQNIEQIPVRPGASVLSAHDEGAHESECGRSDTQSNGGRRRKTPPD